MSRRDKADFVLLYGIVKFYNKMKIMVKKNNKAIHTTPSKHFQNLIEKLQKEMENRYSDTHIHTPEGIREGREFIRSFENQEEVLK